MRRGKADLWSMCQRAETMRVWYDCHCASSGGDKLSTNIYINGPKYNDHIHGE